mgnify:CR=1 FL=1
MPSPWAARAHREPRALTGVARPVAVKIKLMRLGRIRQPYYRIVVADARTRRHGKAIETIGKYHPKEHPRVIEGDSERWQYWIGFGAQPTDPVQQLLHITGDRQRFNLYPTALCHDLESCRANARVWAGELQRVRRRRDLGVRPAARPRRRAGKGVHRNTDLRCRREAIGRTAQPRRPARRDRRRGRLSRRGG